MSQGNVTRYDFSTFLAHRAIDAAKLGPPKAPKLVALPGAKAAIDHDRLIAHQELGHSQDEIVGRVNERWESENATVLDAHREWVAGTYVKQIEALRRVEMQRQAEELRRRALFEEIVREREAKRED